MQGWGLHDTPRVAALDDLCEALLGLAVLPELCAARLRRAWSAGDRGAVRALGCLLVQHASIEERAHVPAMGGCDDCRRGGAVGAGVHRGLGLSLSAPSYRRIASSRCPCAGSHAARQGCGVGAHLPHHRPCLVAVPHHIARHGGDAASLEAAGLEEVSLGHTRHTHTHTEEVSLGHTVRCSARAHTAHGGGDRAPSLAAVGRSWLGPATSTERQPHSGAWGLLRGGTVTFFVIAISISSRISLSCIDS